MPLLTAKHAQLALIVYHLPCSPFQSAAVVDAVAACSFPVFKIQLIVIYARYCVSAATR